VTRVFPFFILLKIITIKCDSCFYLFDFIKEDITHFLISNAHRIIIKIKLFIIMYKMENTKIIVNSDVSVNINIQNAFVELTNNNNSLENSLYWINEYLKNCKDDKIIKIKKLLEISQANINEAFIILDNIVSM
jgi:hypothetical protein